MTIATLLRDAASALAQAGVPEPVRESSTLLRFALKKDRVFLISHPEYELTDRELSAFNEALERRVRREPLQYITGRQEFYGLEFTVTPGVLIPRPETEMLVAKGIELLGESDAPRFAEIGVGSGCISISILANVRAARAAASDISPAAIEVARRNAIDNFVSDRITLIESDLFAGFGRERFELIVSNPPYVPAAEMDGLQPEVLAFEPRTALTDGADGLTIIERIVDQAPAFLSAGGSLVLEFGFGQADRVDAMFDRSIWSAVEIVPDFRSIPRMAAAVVR